MRLLSNSMNVSTTHSLHIYVRNLMILPCRISVSCSIRVRGCDDIVGGVHRMPPAGIVWPAEYMKMTYRVKRCPTKTGSPTYIVHKNSSVDKYLYIHTNLAFIYHQ